MTEPLTNSQKMLNQRLLAEHCLPFDKASQIWESISAEDEEELSFENALKQCNEQLVVIGLEIISVSIKGENFVCLINKHPDEVTKKAFEAHFQVSQHAFVRVILETLVNQGPSKRSDLLNARLEDQENQEEEEDGKPKKASSAKLALDDAQKVIDVLQEGKWIESVKTDAGVSALALAPRTYAELGYLLEQEFGMDAEDLPQQIYYRI